MKTVHVIFNAHIDPIWLWPWQSGLGEVMATCRSACDRLDAHPDLTFTRGEAWVYDEIERLDPALFIRIREHVKAGRWEVIGGWWIQPDCNLPSGFAMERQIGLGKDYFTSRFGAFPRIAYNVDSFGHAAALPGLMRRFGQDQYVMMRPQPEEMMLPSCLFRWRGYEDGPEVVTFRIVESYLSSHAFDEARIRKAVDLLPEGIHDTMFFAGFGDHGGGPTEQMIDWFHDHQDSLDGIKLTASSPSRFFDAIWPMRDALPLVTGELQQHAIGCYSVYRPIKTSIRKAEHLLRQAEIFHEAEPANCPGDATRQIDAAWRRVCFNHFHDTLGGTCLPSAYFQPLAQLGHAQDVAATLLHEGLCRIGATLPADPLQRILFYNASDMAYDGPVEFTPWLDWQTWGDDWRLLDEHGFPVFHQRITPESVSGNFCNLLFSLQVAPRALRVLRIQPGGGPMQPGVRAVALTESLSVPDTMTLTNNVLTFASGFTVPVPTLMLYDDFSDTWSHGLDRYGEDAITQPVWDERKVVEQGLLIASWIRTGTIGESRTREEWRVYGDGFAELRLSVDWREHHKLLKLVQMLPGAPMRRTDGILGGWLERQFVGRELPLRDGMVIESEIAGAGMTLGIAAPDVYAADATTDRIRFTLLRSATMAHHDPARSDSVRCTYSDQGEHQFVFRYFGGPAVTPDLIDRHAYQIQRPLVIAETTHGMAHRLFENA